MIGIKDSNHLIKFLTEWSTEYNRKQVQQFCYSDQLGEETPDKH